MIQDDYSGKNFLNFEILPLSFTNPNIIKVFHVYLTELVDQLLLLIHCNNNNNHHLIISIRIIYCAFQIIVFIVEWYRYFFALQANRLAFIVQYLSLLFIMIETLIIIIQNQLIDGKRSYRIVHMSLPPI